jgi:hypothetical protein
MAFHKHGVFSFKVDVQRIRLVGGDNFVADITALRRHDATGAAETLEVPAITEQYGDTAWQAEGRAIQAMRAWFSARGTAASSAAISSVTGQ